MRKLIKVAAILLAGLVALLIIAAVAVHVLFPPAKVRLLLTNQIHEQLHREAKLQDVSLGLGGLSISGFQLSNVPSFSAGTFLSVENADVRWALLPLLGKHVSVTRILFKKPQITLIKMPDGKTLNISDLTENNSKSPAEKLAKKSPSAEGGPIPHSSSEAGWTWQVNEIRLENGLVRYEDRSPAKMSSALNDIDLTLSDFSLDRVKGHLSIASIRNTVYTGTNFSADWSLHQIDPTLGHITGSMKIKQGNGLVQNLNSLANASKSARLALLPLIALQSLDQLGFVKLGLPNLSHLVISDIVGDYTFDDGLMTIHSFEINGPEVSVSAPGTIQLGSGALSIDVKLHTPKPTLMGEMDMKVHIGGTLSNPQTDLKELKKKAFKASVTQLLNNPDVQKTLKNLFH